LRKQRLKPDQLKLLSANHELKVGLARRLRQETTMDLKWIAEELGIGSVEISFQPAEPRAGAFRTGRMWRSGDPFAELAAELIRLGCHDALNLDGGGSSVMALRNATTGKLGILNQPSDGRERAVANVLGVTAIGNLGRTGSAGPGGKVSNATAAPQPSR
jgi:hypothetical protein